MLFEGVDNWIDGYISSFSVSFPNIPIELRFSSRTTQPARKAELEDEQKGTR